MYDLGLILPLYGRECCITAERMVRSIFSQKLEKYKVKCVIFYDKTVPSEALVCIVNDLSIFRNTNLSVEMHYTGEITSSGYKRNLGVEYCSDCEYIWFVDQDDSILYQNTIEKLFEEIDKTGKKEVYKMKFKIPESISKKSNSLQIFSIPTMPWQYVFNRKSVEGYKFSEDREYGSDIPFVIYYLVDKGYMDLLNESGNLAYTKKELITIFTPLYFYNYLNPNSCLGQNNDKLNEFAVDVRPLFKKKIDEINSKKGENE